MMRILASAATAVALMFSSVAAAQTPPAAPAAPAAPVPPSRCGDVETAPAVPDAATVTEEQMRSAVTSYETWMNGASAVLACRRAEALEARAVSDARTAEFNAANTAAVQVSNAFQAAVSAYTTAHPPRRQRH